MNGLTRRVILVALADTHGGNRLGLLNPATVLHQEDQHGNIVDWQPQLSATQKYLWALYQENIASCLSLARGDDIVVLHDGDVTQGNRYPEMFVSDRMADHVIIAADNLKPWLGYPNVIAMRLAFGTGVHVFGEGSSEVLVTTMLANSWRLPEGIQCLYHGLLTMAGVDVDYAHHGPGPGIRDWTRGNVLRLYLQSLIAAEVKAGRVPPRLVLRAHAHSYKREKVIERIAGQEREFDIVSLPSYCGMNDYARKRSQSEFQQTHGLIAFEIEDGELAEPHPFIRTLDLRTREVL
jgi:hypothetical protein